MMKEHKAKENKERIRRRMELRRSNASGIHTNKRNRSAVNKKEIEKSKNDS